MSFDWKQYVDLAGELIDGRLSNASKEARYRAAISRAYYGVLIPIRDVLEKRNNTQYDPTQVHRQVRSDLQSDDSDVANGLASILNTMIRRRGRADYESDSMVDENTALKQVSDARKALEHLSKL